MHSMMSVSVATGLQVLLTVTVTLQLQRCVHEVTRMGGRGIKALVRVSPYEPPQLSRLPACSGQSENAFNKPLMRFHLSLNAFRLY